MARPVKTSLDYFPLDCHMDTKFKLIEAQFGLKGFAIVVKLLQRIYGELGYYCEWNDDIRLLFADENNVDCNLVSDTIEAALKRGIFSRKMFDEYQILTSSGIQKRYVEAMKRRVKILIDERYLLLELPKNQVNVAEMGINETETQINADRNTINKNKLNKSKYIARVNTFNAFEGQREYQDDDLEDSLLSNNS